QVFSSFFFVSVGMLLDLGFVWSNLTAVLLTTLAIFLLKLIIAAGVARLLSYPLRAALLAGIALCQVGEFAFILLREGMAVQLISDYTYQLLLAVSLFTMLTSPFLMLAGPKLVNRLFQWNLPPWLAGYEKEQEGTAVSPMRNHVIIVGFGVCGRNLAWASQLAGVPYAIVELNPETVRAEREKGEPIIFGDATHQAILRRVHVQTAQMALVAIDDPVATRAIVEALREAAPHLYILVRTRYLREIEPMVALGADDVVPEEFEASVEIFSRVLTKYLIPADEIQRFCAEARARKYQTFRKHMQTQNTMADLTLNIPDFKVEAIRIPKGTSLEGKSLQETELRARYGANVLMVRRGEENISNPSPRTVLQEGDVLVVFGEVKNLVQLFSDMAPVQDEAEAD
ncbi:MAG: NAD-binding protein, partial [Chlamydiia bacterium]|nr:NAD-binding protein [Chlamydiia bacterium]